MAPIADGAVQTGPGSHGFPLEQKMPRRSIRFSPRRGWRIAAVLTAGAAVLATTYAGSEAWAQAAKVNAAAKDAVTDQDRQHMAQAIELMRKAGVVDKTGGPFGAVVVLNGEVLSSSGNSVLRDNDPSAHAEVNAIRAACKKVGSPHVTGATLFSSCEPCPMCYATAHGRGSIRSTTPPRGRTMPTCSTISTSTRT